MAHITLSIPNELYREMKKHEEVKWSSLARTAFIEFLNKNKEVVSSKELFEHLPKETQDSILKANEKEAIKFAKEVRKKEWKRTKYLTRA